MAGHKRRGHLDKPTRDHLTGIEAAIQAMCPEPKREDEFTVSDLFYALKKKGEKCTFEAVRFKLDRMVKSGQCEKRKVSLDGHIANLYRMAGPDSALHGS